MRLRDDLLKRGLITQDQLKTALSEKERMPHQKLGHILCDKGFLSDNDLLNVLTERTHHKPMTSVHNIAQSHIETLFAPYQNVVDDHKKDLCVLYKDLFSHKQAVPFQCDYAEHVMILHVAMLDAEDLLLQDHLVAKWSSIMGANTHPIRIKIEAYHATPAWIAELYERILHAWQRHTQGFLHAISAQQDSRSHATSADTLTFDGLIHKALRARASDIHIQPHAHHAHILFRIDGLLRSIHDIHLDHWTTLCAQIKIYGDMDVAHTRTPQHGRFQHEFAGRMVDCRVSSHPTLNGENIVIRLLDMKKSLLTLDELGFSKEHKELLRQSIQYQHGLIIFTGPTGSGKTTSLYALLNEMDGMSRHIVTLEHPIEYVLPTVRQSEVTPHMNFAQGVRSLLRQDPDVMLIGEIRDEETAHMALRASMTGHLVFTTLHTYDIIQIPQRLMDLGLSFESLVSNIQTLVSQRLVRRVCVLCQGMSSSRCPTCEGTGFYGRICLVHAVHLTLNMRQQWLNDGHFQGLVQHHTDHALWVAAYDAIQNGLTTHDEVIRVLGPEPDYESE